MMSARNSFSIATILWLTVCVAAFFAGRLSTGPQILKSKAIADQSRALAEDVRARMQTISKLQAQRQRKAAAEAPRYDRVVQDVVAFVPDGDTLKIIRDRKEVWVRLEGIDCPENGQPIGKEAQEFTHNACFGIAVRVVEKGRDRYDRILGEVYVGDRNLNQMLLRKGLAWHSAKYNHDPILADLQRQAREAKIGIWSDPNPQPPWEWRRDNSNR